MEIAVLLAAGLRQWIDLGVIIGILLLNAVVGWYQEKQAADVVASLKGDIAMRTTVVRNGVEEEIKARELVPGDIVSCAHSIHSTAVNCNSNDYYRSSSKMDKSSLVTPELSLPTTTPTVTKNTSANWKLRLVSLLLRRTRMMMRWNTSTDRDTLFSLSINLP